MTADFILYQRSSAIKKVSRMPGPVAAQSERMAFTGGIPMDIMMGECDGKSLGNRVNQDGDGETDRQGADPLL
jgi:hypothetical protein